MTWVAIATVTAAGIGAGGQYLAAKDAGDSSTKTSTQTSTYSPEQQQALTTLSNYTKGLDASNLYGATDIDWNDIWEQTKQKINQSYYGSPTSSGAIGKVKASAARRGVSDSPALQTQIGRLGVQANQDIASALSSLNLQKAGYTETARKNWLSQLQGLAGMSPTTTTTTSTGTDDSDSSNELLASLMSSGSSALGKWASNQQSNKELSNLLSNLTTQSSTTSNSSGLMNTDNDTLMSILKELQA